MQYGTFFFNFEERILELQEKNRAKWCLQTMGQAQACRSKGAKEVCATAKAGIERAVVNSP